MLYLLISLTRGPSTILLTWEIKKLLRKAFVKENERCKSLSHFWESELLSNNHFFHFLRHPWLIYSYEKFCLYGIINQSICHESAFSSCQLVWRCWGLSCTWICLWMPLIGLDRLHCTLLQRKTWRWWQYCWKQGHQWTYKTMLVKTPIYDMLRKM